MFSSNSLNGQRLSILIYMASMILRNSPEYYLNDQADNEVKFVLSVINFPRMLVLIVYLVSLAYLVVSICVLVLWKVGSYYFQIFYYIVGPILVYLGKLQIEYGQSDGENEWPMIFYILSEVFICCFILSYPMLQFYIKTTQQQSVNHIGYVYGVVGNLSFMIMGFGQLLKVDSSVVVGALVIVSALRSLLVLSKINFDRIEIEYVSLLGEMYSWLGLVILCMRVFYQLNVQILCWANLLIVLYFTQYPNTLLKYILQQKCIRTIQKFKQKLIYSQDLGWIEQKKLSSENELIELFVCLLHYANTPILQNENQQELKRQKRILLSEYFHAQVLGVIELLIRQWKNSKQEHNLNGNNNQSNNNITAQKQKTPQTTKQHNYTQLLVCQQQQQQRWSLIYKTLQSIKQLQQEEYNKFRQFIIYHLPTISPTSNHKLLRLHYLNVNSERKRQSFYARIVDQLTYRFLTQRMVLEYEVREKRPLDTYQKDGSSLMGALQSTQGQLQLQEQQYLPYNTKIKTHNTILSLKLPNHSRENQSTHLTLKTANQSSSYCLKLPYDESKHLSYYDLYYLQTQVEQNIHSRLQKVFDIQKETIALAAKRQNNQKVLKNLVLKYEMTKQINQILQTINKNHQLKSILYKFILQYSVMNCPHIAINNLKLSNFQDFFLEKVKKQNTSFRKGTIVTLTNQRGSTTAIKENGKEKRMIAFISGVKNFGKIVHCCEVFKEKMDLWKVGKSSQREHNQVDKLTIYDIMLPLWIEKHLQIGQNIFTENNKIFVHKANKVHLVSCHEKRIYECQIKIFPVIRDKEDLLLALNIEYEQVDKLCIYHNQRKVFNSMTNRHTHTRITVAKIGKVLQQDEFEDRNCIKTKENIFGEEYIILKKYKRLRKQNTKKTGGHKHKAKVHFEESSFAKGINPEVGFADDNEKDATTWTFKSTSTLDELTSQRLHDQIKMNEYIDNTLFYSLKLKLFSFMHWSIPPFIMAICVFLYIYTTKWTALNNNIFEAKINFYEKFLMVDTNIFMQLYYMKLVHDNIDDANFRANDDVFPFLLEDLKFNSDFIRSREAVLSQFLGDSQDLLTMFLQDSPILGSASIYFQDLTFDLQAQDYLKKITFNTQTTNQSLNLQTIYTKVKNTLNINRFFDMFKDRYERYFNQFNGISILPALIQLQTSSFHFTETFFLGVLLSLILFISFASVIFVFIYFDLQFHVQKLVLTCLDLPDQLLRNAFTKITQSKDLLQNSKQSSPKKILRKISLNPINETETSFSSSQNVKQFVSNGILIKRHHRKQIYDTFYKTISNSLPELLVFCIVVIFLQSFLILLINELKGNIEETKSFSYGVQKLTGLAALSNELTLEVLLKFQNPNVVSDTNEDLNDYFYSEKMNFIWNFVSSDSKYNELVFEDICRMNDSVTEVTICPQYNPPLTFSYAEVVSSNYRLFKQLFYLVSKQRAQSSTDLFASLNLRLLNLVKHVSLFNRYAHEMVNIGQKNLQQNQSIPQTYFALIILEMAFVVLSFNWFTYKKVYKLMKIYYQQAFKTCPLHQFQKYKALNFYFSQAKQYKINYISGTYQLLE